VKILVLGSSSFAAQGLVDLLQLFGHEVWSFNRRQEMRLGDRGLTGNISSLAGLAAGLQGCDAVVNYLLMKDSSLEANLQLLQRLNELLIAIGCRRFIHVSSVSVLPAVTGRVSEEHEPPRNFRQKGAYARLKIATERWVTDHVTHCQLVLVRPGFVVAPGLSDPLVGIGKLLPNQRILGLGHRNSIIPVISRQILNEGVARLCQVRLQRQRTTVMFTAPDSPTRAEFIEYCCAQFGLGRQATFLHPWIWTLSLAAASVPLSLIKREWNNLPAKFRHNLKPRSYDSQATQKLLNLDFWADWKRLVGGAVEFQRPNFRLPDPACFRSGDDPLHSDPVLCYLGMGRIAQERHLAGLRRLKYQGRLEWYDPFVDAAPANGVPNLHRVAAPPEFQGSLAVVVTPVEPRPKLLLQIPPGITELLFEKPFAISAAQFRDLQAAIGRRTAYIIHNYRFKPNVQWALQYLACHNPGRILETRLHFDSPAVELDRAVWMRDERQARTLLADYALHFLDLAWLFAEGDAEIKALEATRNVKQQTASIQATVKFANSVSCLLLRQGARQRRCQIEFVFSNYTLVLRFFPETAAVFLGQHTFIDDLRFGFKGLLGVAKKVAEKLKVFPDEPSHQYVLGSFLGRYPRCQITSLALANLEPFYSRLFTLAEAVYQDCPARPSRAASCAQSAVRDRLAAPAQLAATRLEDAPPNGHRSDQSQHRSKAAERENHSRPPSHRP
jgi:nucleoside-diphosphate-sugar epimerase